MASGVWYRRVPSSALSVAPSPAPEVIHSL
nr:MAG TPA: hypothetical protein [Caudoviricetes sp.]